jgi:hypothetical protein
VVEAETIGSLSTLRGELSVLMSTGEPLTSGFPVNRAELRRGRRIYLKLMLLKIENCVPDRCFS